MVISERARENRQFVRGLLAERQPDFAAMLESAVRALLCPSCQVTPFADH